jgi:hypothetical protein
MGDRDSLGVVRMLLQYECATGAHNLPISVKETGMLQLTARKAVLGNPTLQRHAF